MPNGDLLLLGDILIELDHFAGELAEVRRLALELHHAGLGLGDVHQGVEHAEHALGFLEAIGQRLAGGGRLGAGLQGDLGHAAQAGQRRAQVVGDVVERLAHGADQGLVLIEQRVEQAHQLVELVVGLADRDAGIELAGADDGAGGGDDLANGPHGAVGEEGAGEETEDDSQAADEKEAAADGIQDGFAAVGRPANLQHPAVPELVLAQGVVSFRVLGDADVRHLERTAPDRHVRDRPPVLRRPNGRDGIARRGDQADEHGVLHLGGLAGHPTAQPNDSRPFDRPPPLP